MLAYFKNLGGEIVLNNRITTLKEIPNARAVLFDLAPKPFIDLAQTQLPASYVSKLARYDYGPGTFKVDWALSEAIPWNDERVQSASTVHVGGTLEEIASSERAAWNGQHSERPYLIVCQQSQLDPTRAPKGMHTGYAYCHVPNGSDKDMSEYIEDQIERFAPGFRDIIRARHTLSPIDFQNFNPNFQGGAIAGGAANFKQLFTRPVARFDPYSTPNKKFFLCSASTPPGGGVHGMCGFWAAQSVLRKFKKGLL